MRILPLASGRPSGAEFFRRALCVLVLVLALPDHGAEAGPDAFQPELKIASEGARPPYNYLEGEDLAGFEIELGRELCRRMKRSCSFIAEEWDSLVPGLLERRYDAIMAAMEITPEAERKIAFSDPYVRMPPARLASRESTSGDTSGACAASWKIGVEAETPFAAYAEAVCVQSEIVPYVSLEEAILDLAEGRIDSVLAGKDALADFLKTRREGQCCRIIADLPYQPAYLGTGIGIGLHREDDGLRAQFNAALAAIRADGTFDRIRAKFFDFDILAPSPLLNGARAREKIGGQVSAVQ